MKEMNETLDRIFPELIKLNEFLYHNPELSNREVIACRVHSDFLMENGFEITKNFLNIPTAFKAVYDSKKSGPTIAVMAEYDALPGIGHGSGHNMIGSIGSGVGVVLKSCLDVLGGRIIVFGTPAEETDGAKVDMAEQGVFDDIDVAMMAHPSSKTYVSMASLAMEAIEFEFIGKAAHAAASPEQGINALDAAIATFNSINALREHIVQTTRIHGIIKEGGVAANIVPERAVAQFYVRSTTKTYLKEVVEKVKNCARGASLATGAKLNIRNYEKSYDNFINNKIFNSIIYNKLKANGFENIIRCATNLGSLDAANVTHVCPMIHPMFEITEEDIPDHCRDFAKATLKPYAIDKMKSVIKALTETGIELIEKPELLVKIKEEFAKAEK